MLIIVIIGVIAFYVTSPIYKAKQSGETIRKTLSSLEITRAKGRRASIVAQMSSLRADAELIFDRDKGSYKNLCSGGILNTSDDTLSYAMICNF